VGQAEEERRRPICLACLCVFARRQVGRHRQASCAAPLATYTPFIIKQSEGALLEDLDGNRFIDFSGGWGCLNVGQRNGRATAALKD